MPETMKQIGEKIKKRRNALKLSREVLAVKAGIVSGTLARIEAGENTTWLTVCAIKAALEHFEGVAND